MGGRRSALLQKHLNRSGIGTLHLRLICATVQLCTVCFTTLTHFIRPNTVCVSALSSQQRKDLFTSTRIVCVYPGLDRSEEHDNDQCITTINYHTVDRG